ncbi:hypothetical protein [Halobacillus sp. A5]|uniref:hypothetical protein n=1 Tax=Halobacillus sp. A5 TaxID=2880263 RepID=UPI0020A6C5DB|nr:hypothetical protein [Halobacillus sp. A5]MCP3026017.1 hypothetical protein [Halobacillus sp. A5]
MDNFALESIKIKSSWFDGGKDSVFQKMGKEKGLELYLQLFRFRVHQGDITKHHFITSVGELQQHTNVNVSTKLSPVKIAELLERFEKLGIIKNHSFKDWSAIYKNNDDYGKVHTDKLLKLEAIDTPETVQEVVKEIKQDIPVTEDDKYINITFETVNEIYEKNLNSKALTVFFFIRKWSNALGGEKKAWMNISKISDRLGFNNNTVTSLLIELNMTGFIHTTVKKVNKRDSFEHVAWFKKWKCTVDEFAETNRESTEIFLKRYMDKGVPSSVLKKAMEKHNWGWVYQYKKATDPSERFAQEQDDVFASVDDSEISDDENSWGEEPVGYRSEDRWAI